MGFSIHHMLLPQIVAQAIFFSKQINSSVFYSLPVAVTNRYGLLTKLHSLPDISK